MLYLGTLDDKTTDYPYGNKTKNEINTGHLLLHHMLHSDAPLILEEGFVLASDEAMYPTRFPAFLIPAIKTGNIKIASREKDMVAYANQRREMQHPGPPNDDYGRRYLANLQKACEQSNAFLHYPRPDIDEITHSRFMLMCDSDSNHQRFDMRETDFPKTFKQTLVNEYRMGNSGRQWTARSAWESAVKKEFYDSPKFVQPLMCMANRERQIVRASGIAAINKIEDMKVETGFERDDHDLICFAVSGELAGIGNNNHLIAPNINFSQLIIHAERFFEALADRSSPLSMSKLYYLHALGQSMDKMDAEVQKLAANDYEREINKLLTTGSTNDDEEKVLGTAEHVADSTGIRPMMSATTAAMLSIQNQKDGEEVRQIIDSPRNRQFLSEEMGIGLVTTHVNDVNTMRSKSTAVKDNISEVAHKLTEQHGNAHQIVTVRPNSDHLLNSG
ncbi:MAG: hypothetical protein HRT35_08240 [Algicola sp.]|nr:hypothetical protein [Algicola sp.]